MSIEKIENSKYGLQTFVGDSGTVLISNIPTDSLNYSLYLTIHGRSTIEKVAQLNGADNYTFTITPTETKQITAGTWEYAVKICNSQLGTEDTCVPDFSTERKALFVVYPEKVKGIK